jgi:hypothetical protein
VQFKFILAAAAAAALGAAAPAAEAAFPGQNGSIVFAQATDGGSGVFSLPVGGSPEQLFATGEAGPVGFTDTSADGTRIAYSDDENVIWVADADGSDRRRLTPEGELDAGPVWSPDGRRLAFMSASEDEELPTIWTMNADGSDRRPVRDAEDPLYGVTPAWSPDGAKIAFVDFGFIARGRPEFAAVFVVDADGSGDVEFVSEGSQPEWAPDGRSLVVVGAMPFGFGDLYRVDVAGGEWERIDAGENRFAFMDPSISPDGTQLVATTRWEEPVRGWGPEGLGVMDLDGSGLGILDGTEGGQAPDWSVRPAAPQPAAQQAPPQVIAQPQPQSQPQPPAPQASVRAAAPSRACSSRRFFSITVRGKRLEKVRVVVNGRRVKAKRKGRGFTARVDLRKLPRGRFTVKVRKTLKSGRVRTETRRYRTCVPKVRS